MPKFLPKELFNKILTNMPIPCVDLAIRINDKYLFVKRKIPPYKEVWAFIGGRIFKGETMMQAIKRIAMKEAGLRVLHPKLVNVYSTKFRTQHKRHDISICFKCDSIGKPKPEPGHYSMFILSKEPPRPLGHLYYKQFKDSLKV